MTKKEEVKTGKNFYLTVFHRIKAGDYPNRIAADLFPNNPNAKQKLYYYTSFFKKQGIISTEGSGLWTVQRNLTDEELLDLVKTRGKNKSSIGVREVQKPITDMHHWQIRFPIISGELKDSDWDIRNKLKNWLPKYKKLDAFSGLTIRNNNNKSITVFVQPAKIDLLKDPYEVEKLAFKLKAYLHEYFKTKHDVILDVMEAETKSIHLETQDNDKLQGQLKKGEMFTLDLQKKAQKIYPKDDIDALAWLDNTPDPNMIATNDLEYKKELLHMPFRMRDLAKGFVPAMEKFNEQLAGYAREIEVHREVQRKQVENQDLMNELLRKGLVEKEHTDFLLQENLKSLAQIKQAIHKNGDKQSKLRDYF